MGETLVTKPVIVLSGRYASKLIQGDVNGQLLPDNDDAQIDAIRLLKEILAARRRDGRAARLMAK